MKPQLFIAGLFAVVAAAQPMPMPLPQIIPPQLESPLEIARQAQLIRNLQLQNQRIELDIQEQQQRIQQNAQGRQQLRQEPKRPDETPAFNFFTNGLLNCRAWGNADEGQQLIYVIAAAEAAVLSFSELDKLADIAKYHPVATNNGAVRIAVSSFCADPENRAIPVIFMARLVAAKSNGWTPEAIENYLALLRKSAAVTDAPPVK